MLILRMADVINYGGERSVAEHPGDPPFATLTDIFGSDEGYDPGDNTYHMWSDMLAGVNYNWYEYSTVMRDDGYILRGALDVYYHEATNEAVAKTMAKRYVRNIKHDNAGYGEKRPLDVSHLDFDDAEGHIDTIGRECIVVREGNKVLCVRLSQFGMYPIPFEEWSAYAAEYLR